MLEYFPELTSRQTEDILSVVAGLRDEKVVQGWFDKLNLARKRARDAQDEAIAEQAKAKDLMEAATLEKAAAIETAKKSRADVEGALQRLNHRETFLIGKQDELSQREDDLKRDAADLKKLTAAHLEEVARVRQEIANQKAEMLAERNQMQRLAESYKTKLQALRHIVLDGA